MRWCYFLLALFWIAGCSPAPPQETAFEPGKESTKESTVEGWTWKEVAKSKEPTNQETNPNDTKKEEQTTSLDDGDAGVDTGNTDGNVEQGPSDEGQGCIPGTQQACKYTGPPGTETGGSCRGGTSTCLPSRQWSRCAGEVLPADEICNGKDDDCNGIIDDYVKNQHETCILPNKAGICASGKTLCQSGRMVCIPQAKPTTEVCNQWDDDCDGVANEDFPEKGKECPLAGKKGLCGKGVWRCNLGRLICQATHQPSQEVCDGKDNDCDGSVDENTVVGVQPCLVPGLQGPCARGAIACTEGKLQCAPTFQAKPEACNGMDDDCNGVIDDRVAAVDQPCTLPGRQGKCKQGITRCEKQVLTCVPNAPRTPETCNGQDDDCNGFVDDNFPERGKACQVVGAKGPCAKGITTCIGGKLSCYQAIRPSAEACNGFDDDCDGVIDEHIGGLGQSCLVAGQLGICATGKRACYRGKVTCLALAAKTETCNNKDDDCNGKIDDVNPNNLQDCIVPGKLGPCSKGKQICTAGKFACASQVQIIPETCNGKDDDCDGVIDETFPNKGGKCQLINKQGLCAMGVLGCRNAVVVCEQVVRPKQEVCNGVDDDCDGATDESYPEQGQSCAVPSAVGLCNVGQKGCVNNQIVCLPTIQPKAEVCNGKDDDCDGKTDESYPEQGKTCQASGTSGNCAASQYACKSGSVVCPPTQVSKPEVCNGKDDDCDGKTDESYPEKDQDCRVAGVFGDCAKSQYSCPSGSLKCLPKVQPKQEVCNGKDDDCDGKTDEEFPEQARSCILSGQTGACASGSYACNAGLLSCIKNPSKIEVCNGKDDDCDGQTDESYPEQGKPCSVQGKVGLCATGTPACKSGVLQCVQTVQPVKENCRNNLDDDCNGKIDDCATNPPPGTCQMDYPKAHKSGSFKPSSDAFFTPDGQFLYTSGGGYVQIWDVAKRTLRRSLYVGETGAFALSKDGKYFYFNNGKAYSVSMWNAQTGAFVRSFSSTAKIIEVPDAGESGIGLSPDGQKLFFEKSWTDLMSQTTFHMDVYNTQTGQLLHTLKQQHMGREKHFRMGLFHPDGNALFYIRPGLPATNTPYLWEFVNGYTLNPIKASRVWDGNAIAFEPKGKYVYVASNSANFGIPSRPPTPSQVVKYEYTTRKIVQTYAFPNNAKVSDLVVNKDDSIAVAGGVEIRYWDTSTGKQLGVLSEPTVGMDFHPDGKQLATVGSSGLLLWNLKTKTKSTFQTPQTGTPPIIWLVQISPKGKYVVLIREKKIELLDGTNLKRLRTWPVSVNTPKEFRWNETETQFLLRYERVVEVYSPTAAVKLFELPAQASDLRQAFFDVGGAFIATTTEGNGLQEWDANNGKLLRTKMASQSFKQAWISEDRKYFIERTGNVHLGKLIAKEIATNKQLWTLSLSPTNLGIGFQVVRLDMRAMRGYFTYYHDTANYRASSVRSLLTGNALSSWSQKAPAWGSNYLDFMPWMLDMDNQSAAYTVVKEKKIARIYRIRDKKLIRTIPGVQTVSVSRDGKKMVVKYLNNYIRLYHCP